MLSGTMIRLVRPRSCASAGFSSDAGGATAALNLARAGALFAFVAAVYLSLVRPLLKRISDARLARLIEEQLKGRVEAAS